MNYLLILFIQSQVREHKDEIEDARAELELEKNKLTQEKADAVKDLQQQLQMKDQYFNDEKQRIHSEHDQQMRQSRYLTGCTRHCL